MCAIAHHLFAISPLCSKFYEVCYFVSLLWSLLIGGAIIIVSAITCTLEPILHLIVVVIIPFLAYLAIERPLFSQGP